MTWKKSILQLIINFCNHRGNRTFTRREFLDANYDMIHEFSKKTNTPEDTVRRVFQELRDEGLVSFVDNRGTYTLRGEELLNSEKEETKTIDISGETPERREYLVETYVRNVGWARKAREVFGEYCLLPKCTNTFKRPDGTPYIEVHHIVPLCEHGEDGLWNLSVLCAHHHRMAHYANGDTKKRLRKTLETEVKCRL